MKVRIIERPSGLLNGVEWPEAGETIDLPDAVAEGMIASKDVEQVEAAAKKAASPKVETRPAPTAKVEKRGAKKTAAKKA